jgi:hypothetical protein
VNQIKNLETQAYYRQIVTTLKNMDQAGLIDRLAGQCVAACDLVQNFLHQVGIESKIVEVQLSVANTNEERPEVPDFMFIGFDGMSYPGQIDTHVIVITKTEIPLFIDLSISHLLPPGQKFVLEPLPKTSVGTKDFPMLSEYSYSGIKLSYQEKKHSRYPVLHQKNIVERLAEDQRMQRNFKFISGVAILSLIITLVNLGLNSGLLYLKFMLG